MAKQYENESPWDTGKQVELIHMIAVLGSDWQVDMSEADIRDAYQLAMAIPGENPAKIGES